ncbi:MAG: hypothetical protein IKX54_03380 [Lachnospiraceae bacterium]|nr:hypothetical protein [Lachnospiraceae bacterium]
MFRFITQKLLNKKWLILSILIGNILLVGIACCNPMYSEAALQKLLTKRMSTYLEDNNQYPSMLTLDSRLSNTRLESSSSRYFDNYLTVADDAERMFGMPAAQKVTFYETSFEQKARFLVSRSGGGGSGLRLLLASLSDLSDHIDIISGSNYSDTVGSDGVIECIVNEKVYLNSQMFIGDEIEIYGYVNQAGESIRLRVVGVFKAKENNDLYWVNDPLSYQQEFFISQDIFVDQFMKDNTIAGNIRAKYYVLYDYSKIDIDQVPRMLEVYNDLETDNKTTDCLYDVYCNYNEIFEQFMTDSAKVKATMWILQVPILVLLAVFIFMVSNQVIDIEQGEIAMLKSRGVSRLQLILTYLTQSAILGGIALLIGIPFGYILCHLFGSTNAFMEFVGRKSMQVRITGTSLMYALGSCVAGILIMTLPVLKFARFSIVEQKAHKRKKTKPLWQRMFLDFMLLALALYGYYDFNNQKSELMKAIANGEAVNPMLFFSASLFILSCAIVFLRVIPMLSSLIFKIGRKKWKPASYASFLQITRDIHKQSFITVFLVLTIALGIFNANIARTVNQNEEERISYNDGADLVVQENWQNNISSVRSGYATKLKYNEGDYTRFERLADENPDKISAITRVIHDTDAQVINGGNTINDINLLAVNTYEFGHAAWMPQGVGSHHWYEDLNALAKNPEGALISRNLAEKCGLAVGDSVTAERFDEMKQSMGRKSFTVVAIIDYWPGYENRKESKDADSEDSTVPNYLIVCNYDNILLDYPVVPYEIWIKTNGSTDFFYDWATENKINFKSFRDRTTDLLGLKNDPYFQVTNGMLTITFIVVLVLCAIGFLIFWITSIRSRELIFGIYRAMGMSMGELIRMLVNEHIFGSLLPILFGAGIGLLASKMFLPLIQIAYSPKIATLPSKIVMSGGDLVKIAVVVTIMLAGCITVISMLLSKIKINQALKLGED